MEADDEENEIPKKRLARQAQGPDLLFFSNTRGNSRGKASTELQVVLFPNWVFQEPSRIFIVVPTRMKH